MRPTTHAVEPRPGAFIVTSGRSGSVYTVKPLGGDKAECSCPAGRHGRACSHVEAVREFAARVLAEAAPSLAPADPFARIRAEEGR